MTATTEFQNVYKNLAKIRFGLKDLEMLEDQRKILRVGDQFFPYYQIHWIDSEGQRWHALLEPSVRVVKRGYWIFKSERYELNHLEMMQKLTTLLSTYRDLS